MFPTAADSEDISQGTSPSVNTNIVSSDALSPSEPAKPHTRELTLNMLFKEMIFCIALALTTYGALHNSPTKVSKHPQAVRFFSRTSPVTDWYRGQLGNALSAINKADVSFVMYYAPWDAECQYVRAEFEKAATVLGDRVYFSAINCWNPGSECRLQHSKIPSWPIIMAYTVTSRGLLYKGPRDAPSMITFLELIMKPLRRVSSTKDLVHLLSICDAVAVGYTPLTDGSYNYIVWHNVATKVHELDSIGEMCFASVISEQLALDLGVESGPTARLMLWNDTKEFPHDSQAWNESALMNWLLDNFSQPVARIIPMWKKSFSFEKFVNAGNPILILFTPLNPMYEQIPNYALLREVAMEYYICRNNESNQWITELLKLQQVQRFLYQKSDVKKFCQEYRIKKSPKPQGLWKEEVISQYNKYPWHNTTQKNQKSSLFNFVLMQGLAISKFMENADSDAGSLSVLGLLDECSTNIFPAEKSFYEKGQCQNVEDKQMDEDLFFQHLGTSMLPTEDDPLSSENLIQENIQHYCKLMKFAYELSPPVLPSEEQNVNITHIHGLACAKNFTLNMIAVDSVRNYHFAESLGIDIKNKKDMTAVVILDSKHESQYVLSQEYGAKSVRDFISNFTYERLKRSLRSNVAAANTHYYGSDGDVTHVDVTSDAVHVIDLSTRTFRRVVTTPGKVSLVALCAGSCGAMTSRAIVSAARLLAECNVPVQAARLDALRHDLPWHYTPETYPTVMVLPPDRGRESESGVLPQRERVTASAVVALALRALGAPQHVRVRLALCQRATGAEKKTCLRDVKEHITTVIGRNLKYWRRASTSKLRSAISERLRRLHHVYLELSLLHVTDLCDGNRKLASLLNSFNLLAKNWDFDTTLLKKSAVVKKLKRS